VIFGDTSLQPIFYSTRKRYAILYYSILFGCITIGTLVIVAVEGKVTPSFLSFNFLSPNKGEREKNDVIKDLLFKKKLNLFLTQTDCY